MQSNTINKETSHQKINYALKIFINALINVMLVILVDFSWDKTADRCISKLKIQKPSLTRERSVCLFRGLNYIYFHSPSHVREFDWLPRLSIVECLSPDCHLFLQGTKIPCTNFVLLVIIRIIINFERIHGK